MSKGGLQCVQCVHTRECVFRARVCAHNTSDFYLVRLKISEIPKSESYVAFIDVPKYVCVRALNVCIYTFEYNMSFVHVYVCVCVYIYIYIYIYIYTHTYLCVSVHASIPDIFHPFHECSLLQLLPH
jgi:hypothetical protein